MFIRIRAVPWWTDRQRAKTQRWQCHSRVTLSWWWMLVFAHRHTGHHHKWCIVPRVIATASQAFRWRCVCLSTVWEHMDLFPLFHDTVPALDSVVYSFVLHFHLWQYTIPGTFLVPPRTKTWRVQITSFWLATKHLLRHHQHIYWQQKYRHYLFLIWGSFNMADVTVSYWIVMKNGACGTNLSWKGQVEQFSEKNSICIVHCVCFQLFPCFRTIYLGAGEPVISSNDGLPQIKVTRRLLMKESFFFRRGPHCLRVFHSNHLYMPVAKLGTAIKPTKATVAHSGPDKPHLNNSHIALALYLALTPFTHH